MIPFLIGAFSGGFIGVTFMALCAIGSKEPPAPTAGRVVYIASPYKGDMKRNLRKAAKYTAAAIKQGKIPIARTFSTAPCWTTRTPGSDKQA